MMARICANCRFENPDGNEYCQRCGTSLTGVPATPSGAAPRQVGPSSPAGIGVRPAASPAYAPPPPAYPSPLPAPASYPPPLGPAPAAEPGYRSPYYPASGPAPQVGRMSPGLIVGVALAALVVLVVVALAGVVAVRALTGHASGPTPSPTVAPTTTPGGGSSTVDTSTFILTAGSAWSLKNRQDNLVDLQAGSGWGLVEVMSQQLSQPETTGQAFSNVEASLQKKYPSITSCIDRSTMTIGGLSGTVKGYLYDEPDGSGSTVQVCDAIWIDSTSNGDIYYYEQVSSNGDFNGRLEPAAKPVRSSIQWKLR
jgi:hypothetical protein